MKRSTKQILIYCILAIALAWGIIYGLRGIIGLVAAESLMMFSPLLAVLLTKRIFFRETTGISWRPHFRGNIRIYLTALFLPTVLTVLGTILYYGIFSPQFDAGMPVLSASLGASADSVIASFPGGLRGVLAAQLLSAIFLAPFMNMLFAVGEEAGWRGFLYPALESRFGIIKGNILGGIIWGVWHFPATRLGHNYGTGYPGFPFVGMLVMCVFCFSFGVIFRELSCHCKSVWPAALAHGALNAVAGLGVLFLSADAVPNFLLGPSPAGLIAVIPTFLIAVFILVKRSKEQSNVTV